ncbi:MAG: HpcH/HpaI aldolase/citrate lyase family protein [Nitrospinota bacterium]
MNVLRSWLFVPAATPERIPKALASGADAVIVDLEDAVSVERKAEAREALVRFLPERPGPSASPPLFVRVNGPGTPWLEADVEAAVLPGLSGIVLPKAQAPEEVAALEASASRVAASRGCEAPLLVPVVESALGLIRAFEIASASPRCLALAFGGEDFTRDIGAVRAPDGEALGHARMQVVAAARAAGVLPVDTVYIDFRDEAGLFRDADRARRMGFAGKLVVHPRQVEGVNRAFSPAPGEVEEARAVVAAFEEAQARGDAVASLDGRMLDPAVVDQARRILGWAEEIARSEGSS